MDTEVRTLLRAGARYWWIPLITGVAWLIVAWLVLRLNQTSITAVGVLIGIVLIVAGVNEAAVAAFVPGVWKVWHIIMAVIFLLGGLWGLIRPVNTFFALASVLGLVLVLYGAFEIARSIASRAMNPYWWINLDRRHPPSPAGLLDIRIRPGLRLGPTGLPDPVLCRIPRFVQRDHADHAGLRDSPRRPAAGRPGDQLSDLRPVRRSEQDCSHASRVRANRCAGPRLSSAA